MNLPRLFLLLQQPCDLDLHQEQILVLDGGRQKALQELRDLEGQPSL